MRKSPCDRLPLVPVARVSEELAPCSASLISSGLGLHKSHSAIPALKFPHLDEWGEQTDPPPLTGSEKGNRGEGYEPRGVPIIIIKSNLTDP